MIYNVKRFICDDCKISATFFSIDSARCAGWVVGRDRKRCFCPSCGHKHVNVGRKPKYGSSYSNKVHLDLT